jgi:hypothetical protein
VAKRWNAQFTEGFRVSVVDAWLLTDNRPETTNEGRHWIDEGKGNFVTKRPLIGEAEGKSLFNCLADVRLYSGSNIG